MLGLTFGARPRRERERGRDSQSVCLSVAPRVSNMLSWVGLDLRQAAAGRTQRASERASLARWWSLVRNEEANERANGRTTRKKRAEKKNEKKEGRKKDVE